MEGSHSRCTLEAECLIEGRAEYTLSEAVQVGLSRHRSLDFKCERILLYREWVNEGQTSVKDLAITRQIVHAQLGTALSERSLMALEAANVRVVREIVRTA